MPDQPDFYSLVNVAAQDLTTINVDILSQTLANLNVDIISQSIASLIIKALADNNTVTEEVEDSYETVLNWATENMGQKVIIVKEAATGTTQDDIDLESAAQVDFTDAWTKCMEEVIAADDLLVASFKYMEYTGLITTPNTQIDYKVTYQQAGGTETTIITGTDTFTASVEATKTHNISPEVKAQHDVAVTVRFYLKSTTAGGVGWGKDFLVRYDDEHEPLDYQVLAYAYDDGTAYTEATGSLAQDASARVAMTNVYSQVKVQAKAQTAGRKGKIRVDYIGVSL